MCVRARFIIRCSLIPYWSCSYSCSCAAIMSAPRFIAELRENLVSSSSCRVSWQPVVNVNRSNNFCLPAFTRVHARVTYTLSSPLLSRRRTSVRFSTVVWILEIRKAVRLTHPSRLSFDRLAASSLLKFSRSSLMFYVYPRQNFAGLSDNSSTRVTACQVCRIVSRRFIAFFIDTWSYFFFEKLHTHALEYRKRILVSSNKFIHWHFAFSPLMWKANVIIRRCLFI